MPKGYTTLTTYLVAQDADGLINFMTKTFGAEETFRSGPGSEGGLHCEVKIGDSMLMVGGGGAGMKWRGTPMPSAFHIYVPDCDATYGSRSKRAPLRFTNLWTSSMENVPRQ